MRFYHDEICGVPVSVCTTFVSPGKYRAEVYVNDSKIPSYKCVVTGHLNLSHNHAAECCLKGMMRRFVEAGMPPHGVRQDVPQ